MSVWLKFGLLAQEELDLFQRTYKQVTDSIQRRLETELEEVHLVKETVRCLLDYNVPHGKQFRGLMSLAVYKCLTKNSSTEDFYLAAVMGWALEIAHGCGLVMDDIMDRSETRRGRPCWYKLPGVGLTAINDSFMLEQLGYLVARIYFIEKPYYGDMIEIMKDVALKTNFGQDLDLRTENLEFSQRYTMERYGAIAKYKTSYYTIYAPMKMALLLAGKTEDEPLFQPVKKLGMRIGYYFQVQDDFLDVYGDAEVTGKFGTDIQDGKCSWLVVTALEMCDDRQRRILKENYGRDDDTCVEKVLEVYEELNMVKVYAEFEKDTYRSIADEVESLPAGFPKKVFRGVLGFLYKRIK